MGCGTPSVRSYIGLKAYLHIWILYHQLNIPMDVVRWIIMSFDIYKYTEFDSMRYDMFINYCAHDCFLEARTL